MLGRRPSMVEVPGPAASLPASTPPATPAPFLALHTPISVARMLGRRPSMVEVPGPATSLSVIHPASTVLNAVRIKQRRPSLPSATTLASLPASTVVGITRLRSRPQAPLPASIELPPKRTTKPMAAMARLFGLRKPPTLQPSAPEENGPPTSADLEAVGDRAEAEVARICKYVRLEMAKRMIILLAPVQFFGSKHSAGVDVYLEPEEAEQICSEVATTLRVCNDMLAEMNRAPLGLAVEGHTSASIHGHTESLRISSLRANQCGKSIRKHLVEKGDGEADETGAALGWGLPIDGLVTQRGCGSTMPLPGFDDGGNHTENRRVEMRLLEPGQEGYCSTLSEVDGSSVKIEPRMKTKNFARSRRLESDREPGCQEAKRLRREAQMKAQCAANAGSTQAEQRKLKADVKELRAKARRLEADAKDVMSTNTKPETLRSVACPVPFLSKGQPCCGPVNKGSNPPDQGIRVPSATGLRSQSMAKVEPKQLEKHKVVASGGPGGAVSESGMPAADRAVACAHDPELERSLRRVHMLQRSMRPRSRGHARVGPPSRGALRSHQPAPTQGSPVARPAPPSPRRSAAHARSTASLSEPNSLGGRPGSGRNCCAALRPMDALLNPRHCGEFGQGEGAELDPVPAELSFARPGSRTCSRHPATLPYGYVTRRAS